MIPLNRTTLTSEWFAGQGLQDYPNYLKGETIWQTTPMLLPNQGIDQTPITVHVANITEKIQQAIGVDTDPIRFSFQLRGAFPLEERTSLVLRLAVLQTLVENGVEKVLMHDFAQNGVAIDTQVTGDIQTIETKSPTSVLINTGIGKSLLWDRWDYGTENIKDVKVYFYYNENGGMGLANSVPYTQGVDDAWICLEQLA